MQPAKIPLINKNVDSHYVVCNKEYLYCIVLFMFCETMTVSETSSLSSSACEASPMTASSFFLWISKAIEQDLMTATDCDSVIQHLTLYAVMCYSGASGTLNVLLSFIVYPLGKKRTTILVFVTSATAGLVLLFVKIPLLSIALFYVFLYVALILGNVNTYLVELNPTYLRGMATCLSVVIARGFGFFSVQLIAQLLTDHCTPMISGYVVLVSSGLAIAFFLPSDGKNNLKNKEQIKSEAPSEHEKTWL